MPALATVAAPIILKEAGDENEETVVGVASWSIG